MMPGIMIARSFLALTLAALACPALAQSGGPRTLAELKADIQERADRNAYPVSDLDAAEVREALGNLKTLDRDEWASVWSAVGDRHMEQARLLDPAKLRVLPLRALPSGEFPRESESVR